MTIITINNRTHLYLPCRLEKWRAEAHMWHSRFTAHVSLGSFASRLFSRSATSANCVAHCSVGMWIRHNVYTNDERWLMTSNKFHSSRFNASHGVFCFLADCGARVGWLRDGSTQTHGSLDKSKSSEAIIIGVGSVRSANVSETVPKEIETCILARTSLNARHTPHSFYSTHSQIHKLNGLLYCSRSTHAHCAIIFWQNILFVTRTARLFLPAFIFHIYCTIEMV